MREIILMTLSLLMVTQAQPAEAFWSKKKEPLMERAEKYYENREYYRAREATFEILAENPNHEAAQALMGKILDKEIERQKEQVYPMAVEEMDSDDRSSEIKTWLERSNALLARKEYDLALFAAEKVFIFDAENRQASELIDRIKERAIKEGKADVLFLGKMYKEEIAERLSLYRDRARELARDGHFGQARFTVEKILLLEPEDPQALSLYQNVLEQEEAFRHEA